MFVNIQITYTAIRLYYSVTQCVVFKILTGLFDTAQLFRNLFTTVQDYCNGGRGRVVSFKPNSHLSDKTSTPIGKWCFDPKKFEIIFGCRVLESASSVQKLGAIKVQNRITYSLRPYHEGPQWLASLASNHRLPPLCGFHYA